MNTIDIKNTVTTEIFDTLESVKKMQSFDKSFYPVIDDLVAKVASGIKDGRISEAELKKIRCYYGQEFLENTLQGSALLKKYGYAGDFLMIDAIYSYSAPKQPFFKSWDNYFHHQSAPQAVRNRKEYFKKWVKQNLKTKKEINLLNIASGPGRDILELFEEKGEDCKLNVTCIDADKFAIEYAERITHPYHDFIEYQNVNIFKFKPHKEYDLIWSAGAFDYFNDKTFLYLINKFKGWGSENCEIAIGNFNADHNPTRPYMEIFGDWILYHRTSKELNKLGLASGYFKENIKVCRERENVNLFLHLNSNRNQIT